MDIGRAFSFIMEDKEWVKKLLIAGVLSLTGIGMFPVWGWVMEIDRRVIEGDPEPLPGWENIGQFFINGLKFFAVVFVWSLPMVLLISCLTSLIAFSGQSLMDSNAGATTISIVGTCIGFLTMIYSLLIGLLAIPLMGMFDPDKPFGELIRPQPAMQLLRANIGGFLIAMILGSFIASILGSLGSLLCLVGIVVTIPFSYAFYAHLIGQAHATAKANLGI